MNILQKILKNHYEEIEYSLHPRPVVMENIEKMVNCGLLLKQRGYTIKDDVVSAS